MNRDDMTHMEAVFLPIDRDRPALPYDEFITEGGRHPIGGDIESKIGGHYYAKYVFPNGTEVSVVCGQLFYSTIDAPYEVMFEDDVVSSIRIKLVEPVAVPDLARQLEISDLRTVSILDEKGVFVVNSTRAGSGRIAPASGDLPGGAPVNEAQRRRRQFSIAGEDHTPVKARILLMMALTKTTDRNEIQRIFSEY